MRWVNATDLSQWAERRDGQGSMPELLTRLVRAAVGLTAQLLFPSDESVQLSGWDGICNVTNGTEHIPSGNSGWEIGTQRQAIKAKAHDDYTKSTAKPLGLDRKKTTFVFVTPRHWTEKGEWARARRAEKKWADVRAYQARRTHRLFRLHDFWRQAQAFLSLERSAQKIRLSRSQACRRREVYVRFCPRI